MEVTEELIKNQKTEASQIDGKYTVLVSGAGATCNEYESWTCNKKLDN